MRIDTLFYTYYHCHRGHNSHSLIMNPDIKNAFSLSIASLSGISTYLFIVLCERFSLFYINAHFALTVLMYLATVIAPIVFAIVALVQVNKVKQVEGRDVAFRKLTTVFSWITLGLVIFYLTLVITLLIMFGLNLFVI